MPIYSTLRYECRTQTTKHIAGSFNHVNVYKLCWCLDEHRSNFLIP